MKICSDRDCGGAEERTHSKPLSFAEHADEGNGFTAQVGYRFLGALFTTASCTYLKRKDSASTSIFALS